MSDEVVLVDDEEIVCSHWEHRFRQARRAIRIFRDPSELVKETDTILHSATLFIDKNLRRKTSGLLFSKYLFELGYKNIYISTAEHFRPDSIPAWILGFIGKTPPHWLFQNQVTTPLTSLERASLISQMSDYQMEIYKKRIQQFLEISYGMDSGAFPGPTLDGFNIPDIVMQTWERAITLSMSDEEIKSATDYAWSLV